MTVNEMREQVNKARGQVKSDRASAGIPEDDALGQVLSAFAILMGEVCFTSTEASAEICERLDTLIDIAQSRDGTG